MFANDDDDCDCGVSDNSMGKSLDKIGLTSSQSK
jgi:hypothetical protein